MPVLERQFSERFLRSAGRPALGCLGACFSYAELQARVAAIAVQLRGCGLVAGDRVGLHLARSPDLVAAVLACLREGLCFVPLEPEFPLRRLHAIATEAQLALVLQDEPVAFPVPTWRLRPGLSGELEWPEQDEGMPAYMMFTSGSTGRPKGVVIGRAALDAAHRPVACRALAVHHHAGIRYLAVGDARPAMGRRLCGGGLCARKQGPGRAGRAASRAQ
ncbi:AMP-binding protein [Stutzerimonas balearica]|uniref:AMP-binding protein n=1 Tax=Stutzerimonas balearica TaxID=74829 RepID=UPI0028A85BDB|nr:AMP-binding protein [Stutzerimonas balearica]